MGSVTTEGCVGLPVYVSETRNLYLYKLNLLPVEGGSRTLYEDCAVTGFELRINRREAIKGELDLERTRTAEARYWRSIGLLSLL
jgi:hypothetical protein